MQITVDPGLATQEPSESLRLCRRLDVKIKKMLSQTPGLPEKIVIFRKHVPAQQTSFAAKFIQDVVIRSTVDKSWLMLI